MKVKTNLVGGSIFVIVGSALLVLLNKQVITYGDIDFLQSAKVIPFFAEIVMVIGGSFLIIQSLFFKKEKIIVINRKDFKTALTVLAAFTLYAVGIYFSGFIIGSILFVITMFFIYQKNNIYAFFILFLLALGIYFLFTGVFHVQLPGLGGKI